MSGELQIVVSADLGELGPTDGKPVSYHFSPLYHALGFIPWLLVSLAFVVLKENRALQAAWILAPIALLAAGYWAFMAIAKATTGDRAQMNTFFTITVLGFSMIWLLADRIGKRGRFVAFLSAAAICFGFLGAGLLTGGFGQDMMTVAILASLSILPILLAFAAASRLSSKSFGKARFLVVAGAVLFISFAVILSVVTLITHPSHSLRGRIGEVHAWAKEPTLRNLGNGQGDLLVQTRADVGEEVEPVAFGDETGAHLATLSGENDLRSQKTPRCRVCSNAGSTSLMCREA